MINLLIFLHEYDAMKNVTLKMFIGWDCRVRHSLIVTSVTRVTRWVTSRRAFRSQLKLPNVSILTTNQRGITFARICCFYNHILVRQMQSAKPSKYFLLFRRQCIIQVHHETHNRWKIPSSTTIILPLKIAQS